MERKIKDLENENRMQQPRMSLDDIKNDKEKVSASELVLLVLG